ncbi:LPS export ABC transporter periplasmic protein LptC [Erythrobacter sp. LQ02-29]|uniref:LPS export ABC transporter periplasmic protein LptC n=1 Tax=Erythrobacter sp. LQ02-29 TaxID=2920384 RepID=UPI001F4DF3A7|nr:LPS export ABC transporter periplasmic protein LptC [Erythrobacter sp. LQ02-29]MCP9221978.1 LPS export ABC transporter periplasmic protein LptC [Erythrobacter sp. LQ02-29]
MSPTHTQRRIETEDAKKLRRGRQRFATPGGFHDKLVRVLAIALPMGVGVVAALMVMSPLTPRGEVSFLLDRDKVAKINDRLDVQNALYRGADDKGRPFSLMAKDANQRSSAEGIVRLDTVVGRILLSGGPARLLAPGGAYDLSQQVLNVAGALNVTAADGYRFVARGVSIDVGDKTVTGSDGVEGSVPAGTFSADRLEADLDARTVALDGHARLRMVPGKMRMP